MSLLLFMVGLVLCLCFSMFALLKLWFLDLWNRAHEVAREELVRFARVRDGEFRPGDEAPAVGSASVEIEGCACRAAYHFRWVESPRASRASKGLLVTKSIRADLRDLWTERLDPERFVAAMDRARLGDAGGADALALLPSGSPSERYIEASEALADWRSLSAAERPARVSGASRPSLEALVPATPTRPAPASAERRRSSGRHKWFDVKATSRGLRFRAGPRVPLDELATMATTYLRLYARAVDEANRPEATIYR